MNNQTVMGSNNTTREKFASGPDNVDESWALALLEEALEGSFPQESNKTKVDSYWEKDAITVDESESEVFQVIDERSLSPSAIEIQQQAYNERKCAEGAEALSNSCKSSWLVRLKTKFTGK